MRWIPPNFSKLSRNELRDLSQSAKQSAPQQTTPKMVARRKLFTYQVTYSIPGISSSKITKKTSGGRHKSSYNIERFRGPPFLLLLQNYIKLLIFVVSSFCPMIPLSPLVQTLHPPILLTPILSLKILIINVIRDCLRVKNFA